MRQSNESVFKHAFSGAGKRVAATLIATMALAHNAQAAFVMSLEDTGTGDYVQIYDGSGNDSGGPLGVISYSGIVGNFDINVTTGISKPVIGPGALDLNSINVSSGSGGTLVVRISDTDFTGPAPATYNAAYGGTTDGAVDFSFLYDVGNSEFGGSSFASGGFAAAPGNQSFSADLSGAVTPANPYSLTIVAAVIHSSGVESTSFNAEVSAVPLPASAWLFGSALLGLAVSGRRLRR